MSHLKMSHLKKQNYIIYFIFQRYSSYKLVTTV
jgi:hypothetical protein